MQQRNRYFPHEKYATPYVEYKGRIVAPRCSATIRTPHFKLVHVRQKMVSSPFLALY